MNSLRSATKPRNDASTDKLIRLFQSETAEIDEAPEPGKVQSALLIVAVMLVVLLGIAIVMPVDRVVESINGKVVTVEPTLVVQAFDQSIIRGFNVRAGDRVAKGQLLATLDQTLTSADVRALQTQIASDNAQIARCQAELAQLPFNPSPADGPYAVQQRNYYLQRKAQFDAQLRSYQEQIDQLKATQLKYQVDMARYGDRDAIAKKVETMRQRLAAAQVDSQLNLLMAADQQTEMLRLADFDRNALNETQHQLAAAEATKKGFVEQWFSGVSYELLGAEKDRDGAQQQLDKANLHQGLVRMEAPQDAVVLSVAKLSVGSVLASGAEVFELAPLHSPMEVELAVSQNEIGFIRVGDDTTIKFDAFNPAEHGTADGTVRWISDGAFLQDDAGQPTAPYYRVRIKITKVKLHDVPADFRLIPGMTLTGDIHVGHRSLFTYLTRGIVNGFSEAMREP